jgi:hypothetical protein
MILTIELKDWEMKDREYELCDGTRPIHILYLVALKRDSATIHYNKEKQSVHILRYATNQPSFFVEKQSKEEGSVLSEIILITED